MGRITTGLILEHTRYSEDGGFETYGIEMPRDEKGRYLVEYYVASGGEGDRICYGGRVYLKPHEKHLSNRELVRLYWRRVKTRIDDHGLAGEEIPCRKTAP